MVDIISREEWGAEPWRSLPYWYSIENRTEFFVHYHGGIPRHDRGDANAREIEDIHLANGWSGVGYNFIVGQDGEVREGRGWNRVGAHCPGHNRSGIGVYVAIGGNQSPTRAALASVRALYDEACDLAGRTLAMRGHRDGKATQCPGDKLYDWVCDGMPVTSTVGSRIPDFGTEEDDFMALFNTREDFIAAVQAAMHSTEIGRTDVSFGEALDSARDASDEVWGAALGTNPGDGVTPVTAGYSLEIARNYAYLGWDQVRALRAELVGTKKVLEAMASANGISPTLISDVQAAVREVLREETVKVDVEVSTAGQSA